MEPYRYVAFAGTDDDTKEEYFYAIKYALLWCEQFDDWVIHELQNDEMAYPPVAARKKGGKREGHA